MQFSTTFPLLSLAAYVRAQCTGRPDTVDGQAFTYVCSWNGENFCHYTGGDEGAGTIGPLCVYWFTGEFSGYCDCSNSASDCPAYMGLISGGCTPCSG
ncbi:hypothetical protein EDD17DRAFT_1569074 [Pisolithus thermaeus]|nr:hypothetical protein EDD17DRAFT_1569074 [Pisolithus thermaeus]